MQKGQKWLSVVVLAATLGISGCGGDDGTGTGTPASAVPSIAADAALAAMVPDAIKADGKILAGTEATYAPNEFLDVDGKTVIGFDVDLFRAVAAKLGLTAEFQPGTFGDIIPGVSSGKYEIGVSSITINPERKEQALMVSYFEAGSQFAVKKDNPNNVNIDDLCGKKLAVQRDTVQVGDLTKRSEACVAAGKQAITIDQYPGQDQAANAVVSGKNDAMLADSPVSAYAVKQSGGQLELLGEVFEAAPYGYVVSKDQQAFADAVMAAVNALIKDGQYAEVLKAWGVDQGSISESKINP
nr:ABC transporter substrate-binding protein [Catelliglobosispora koreensis]